MYFDDFDWVTGRNPACKNTLQTFTFGRLLPAYVGVALETGAVKQRSKICSITVVASITPISRP